MTEPRPTARTSEPSQVAAPHLVRRRDRAKDDAWIEESLGRAAYGFLASVHDGRPFLNSNLFVFDQATHSIYLHTARVGRTAVNAAGGGPAAFSVASMGRLLPAQEALEFSVEYSGVVAFGQLEAVEDVATKRWALELLLAKYAPLLQPGRDYRPVTDRELGRTAVHALRIESWSGKEKVAAEDFPGAYRLEEGAAPSDPGRRAPSPTTPAVTVETDPTYEAPVRGKAELPTLGRVWHGWTRPEQAAAYERLLQEEVFPAIAAKGLAGYRGLQLFRREVGDEVEFKTVMWFESLDAVRAFAGDEYERAYVPDAARALLSRYDERSQHYEIQEALSC